MMTSSPLTRVGSIVLSKSITSIEKPCLANRLVAGLCSDNGRTKMVISYHEKIILGLPLPQSKIRKRHTNELSSAKPSSIETPVVPVALRSATLVFSMLFYAAVSRNTKNSLYVSNLD